MQQSHVLASRTLKINFNSLKLPKNENLEMCDDFVK